MIFPVKVPYQVTADITKYQGEVYNKVPDPFYLEQKQKELDRFGDQVLSVLPTAEASVAAVCTYFQQKGTGLRNLALQLEEDIAILRSGTLEAICFCYPSGFVPAEKIGMNFFDMHLPVADGERLRAASEKVTSLISKEGSMFRRYVWTLTALPELSQHPALKRPVPESIEDLYFRKETQTTIGLSDDICLFLVKVDMQPLSILWDNADQRSFILNSINSMTESTLSYKHLHHIKRILNG